MSASSWLPAPLTLPQGCVLLFSHCWPTGLAEPYHHPLWKLAESLGAECATQYDKQVRG